MIQSIQYPLDVIQEEVRQLVQRGVVSRQQPIYALCKYVSAREWASIERELETNDFLLRDRIADLVGCEDWEND